MSTARRPRSNGARAKPSGRSRSRQKDFRENAWIPQGLSQRLSCCACCDEDAGATSRRQERAGSRSSVTSIRISCSRRAISIVTLSPGRYCCSRSSSRSARTRKSSIAKISSSTLMPAFSDGPSVRTCDTSSRPLSFRVAMPSHGRPDDAAARNRSPNVSSASA